MPVRRFRNGRDWGRVRLRKVECSWLPAALSAPHEGAFIDDGWTCERTWQHGAVVFGERTGAVTEEANAGEFLDKLLFRKEALRFALKLREDQGLSRHGLTMGGQCVAREREHKQVGTGSGHACRFGKSMTELGVRAGEVPNSVRNHQVETPGFKRQQRHRGHEKFDVLVRSLPRRTMPRGFDHWYREVGSHDVVAQPCERKRIACRATP